MCIGLALNTLLRDEYEIQNLVITEDTGVFYIKDATKRTPTLNEFLRFGDRVFLEEEYEEEITQIPIDLYFYYEHFPYMKDIRMGSEGKSRIKVIDDFNNKITELLNSITKDNVIIEKGKTRLDDEVDELFLTYVAKIK